jgi:hypothetical protein
MERAAARSKCMGVERGGAEPVSPARLQDVTEVRDAFEFLGGRASMGRKLLLPKM